MLMQACSIATQNQAHQGIADGVETCAAAIAAGCPCIAGPSDPVEHCGCNDASHAHHHLKRPGAVAAVETDVFASGDKLHGVVFCGRQATQAERTALGLAPTLV